MLLFDAEIGFVNGGIVQSFLRRGRAPSALYDAHGTVTFSIRFASECIESPSLCAASRATVPECACHGRGIRQMVSSCMLLRCT